MTELIISTERKTGAYYKTCGLSLSETKIGIIQKLKDAPLSCNSSTLLSFHARKKKEEKEEEEKEEGGG